MVYVMETGIHSYRDTVVYLMGTVQVRIFNKNARYCIVLTIFSMEYGRD